MRYHNILHDDMRNGPGLRVVLFVSGCNHHCPGCQNPVTWDPDDGEEFTIAEMGEIIDEMSKDYISGLTISGGDPLHPKNRSNVQMIVKYFKNIFPGKTIWIYTGYTWRELKCCTRKLKKRKHI